jgi:hypothetical protein
MPLLARGSADRVLRTRAPPGHQCTRTAPGDTLTLSLGDALFLAVAQRLGVKEVTAERYCTQVVTDGLTSAVVVQL